MTYVVLARKWRPQTFADLVGQGHVSRTLANAIATDRVAHAFLFTGVRGVGKTTSARILAKALNCAEGPTATPCLKCPQCVEIGEGTDVDVREIDGASYNGIDEVRRLQESLPYRPSRDRFKIYIVDEVHMLSTAAWNAFLKTLEEPPPHVKFIFATTEVNKVPVTILSRCQRYDFKLIGIDAIAERLYEVLKAEKVEADDAAVRIVAREAAGSMRDAMSLLDQVIAWIGGSDEKLTTEGVARVLGVASRSVLHQIGAAVVDGQPARCIEVVGELAQQGFSLSNVARDLLQYLRDLVVASVSPDPGRMVDLADSELTELSELAKRADTDDLSRIYLGFSRAFDDIVRSAQPRGALEMALVRLSRRPPLVPLDELLRKLAEMERRLATGGLPGGGSAGGGSSASRGGGGRPSAPRGPEMGAHHAAPPSHSAQPHSAQPQSKPPASSQGQSAPSQTQSAPSQTGHTQSGPAPSPKQPSPAPAHAQGHQPQGNAPQTGHAQSRPPAQHSSRQQPEPAFQPPQRFQQPNAPRQQPNAQRQQPNAQRQQPNAQRQQPNAQRQQPNAQRQQPNAAFQPPQRFQQPSGHNPNQPPRPAPADSAPTQTQAPHPNAPANAADPKRQQHDAPPAPLPTKPVIEPAAMRDWEDILRRVDQDTPRFAAYFRHAAPLQVRPGELRVGFAQEFIAQQASDKAAIAAIEAAASAHFDEPTKLDMNIDARHSGIRTVAQKLNEEQQARLAEARRRVEEHPVVLAAIELLGAELRDVRLPAEMTQGGAP